MMARHHSGRSGAIRMERVGSRHAVTLVIIWLHIRTLKYSMSPAVLSRVESYEAGLGLLAFILSLARDDALKTREYQPAMN